MPLSEFLEVGRQMRARVGTRPVVISSAIGTRGHWYFFADLHRVTGAADYLRWAEKIVGDLVKRSSPGTAGRQWIQAEHRVRPKDVHAQTGYAQGASGIGLFLLKMHAVRTGSKFEPMALPDSPFGKR